MDALWLSNAIIHIVTDVALLIMPMPILSTLQLPKKQKLAIIGIFAVGGFVCITSGLRLQSLRVIGRSQDKTWDNVGAAAWSAVECNVGIICCCLPTLRPLVARLFPRFLSSSYGYSSNTKRRCTLHRPTKHESSRPAGTMGQEYALQSFTHSRSRNEQGSGDTGGITVTKVLVQESVEVADDSSRRKLMRQAISFNNNKTSLPWSKFIGPKVKPYAPYTIKTHPLSNPPAYRVSSYISLKDGEEGQNRAPAVLPNNLDTECLENGIDEASPVLGSFPSFTTLQLAFQNRDDGLTDI
ncbi:hypothetical protein AJ80_04136 [Polytolypa hystricis UAMH7299]|uniref:Rhodopsin domain-containing protein n=1 Tax=Polytolypa hystricis (strain UAMH7299) TaxID=1447883 RepID=A0A2B7YDW1_POLH7|nr:hypothetical protein AJ80_04136 [Polytolypa hystricis UAMH7299]